jgi:5'-nucleotidase
MDWDIICFDLDNTLINYEKTFERTMEFCFALLVAEYTTLKQITFTKWFPIFKKYCDLYWSAYSTKVVSRKEYRRIRYISAMNELGVQTTHHQAERLQHFFNQHVANFVVPFNGVVPFLKKLKHHNKKLGIITNGKSEIQYKKLQKAGFIPYFDSVIISDDVNVAKPSTDIFYIAKERLGKDNDRCVYIGDSWELDIQSAMKANWDAIYFNSRNEKMFNNKDIVKEVRTIAELSKLLV